MIDLWRGAIVYHILIVHYEDQQYWIDNTDKDIYSYLKIVADVYKLMGKSDVNFTISYKSGFLIKKWQ